MAKTVDIAERTLEKEKKHFIGFCKACEGFSIFLMVFMIAGCIAQLFDLFVDIVTNGRVICATGNIVTYAGIAVALKFSITIFGILKKGGTPFTYSLADKVKGAAMALTVTGALGFVLELAIIILNATGMVVISDFTDFVGGLHLLVIGIVLMALSYIFNYGCKLQQESDETL